MGTPPIEPRSRLGRAATNAFGIAVAATSLVACKDPPAPTNDVPEASAPALSAPVATTAAIASSAPVAPVAPVASAETAPPDAGSVDAGRPKVITKPTATRHPNLAKPYGAPPADGLVRIV